MEHGMAPIPLDINVLEYVHTYALRTHTLRTDCASWGVGTPNHRRDLRTSRGHACQSDLLVYVRTCVRTYFLFPDIKHHYRSTGGLSGWIKARQTLVEHEIFPSVCVDDYSPCCDRQSGRICWRWSPRAGSGRGVTWYGLGGPVQVPSFRLSTV